MEMPGMIQAVIDRDVSAVFRISNGLIMYTAMYSLLLIWQCIAPARQTSTNCYTAHVILIYAVIA